MSAADELRTAATRIRELATADGIPPGPWTITPRYRKGTKTVVQYDMHKPPPPGSNTPGLKVIHPSRTDALYSAALHPGVGLALADWLDEEAGRRAASVVAAVEIWGNAEHPDAVAWLTTGLGKGSAPALALARLINTGSST